MDQFLQSQIPFILALQSIPGLAGLMDAFSFLGREEFFILLLPLVYLCFDPAVGVRLGYVVLMGDSLNAVLKMFIHLPRPYWIDTRVQPLSSETSYGLPSNHAQTGTAVWFYLANAVRKPWAWVAAAVIVLLISISRIYLGMHFPTDVIGGWVIGAIFLVVFIAIEPKVSAKVSGWSLGGQITGAFGLSVLMLLIGFVVRALSTGATDAALWASFTTESLSLNGIAADAGALFGISVAWAMAKRWAAFQAKDAVLKRVGRFVVGAVLVGLIYFGLKAVFPTEPEPLGLTFRYIRYMVMGWGAVFLAPWVCLRLKLAEPPK